MKHIIQRYNMNGSGYGRDVMNANEKWPEKMSQMDQEQFEEVPQICPSELDRLLSCVGLVKTVGGNERHILRGNKLTCEHSCCAVIFKV